MEGLKLLFQITTLVRFSIERGESVQRSIENILTTQSSRELRHVLHKILLGQNLKPTEQAFADIIAAGQRGESVLQQLSTFETELTEKIEMEIENYAALLPIKALFPLLLLQFPALLAILFGPMLMGLAKTL